MKKIFKKCVAVLLVLCMAFSACVLSVSASDISGTVKSSLSKDLSWFGYALVTIANTTDDDDFKESAASINSWLCGGSNVSFKLSEISAMCEQLLDEVGTLNTQNKEILSAVEKLGLKTDYDAMCNAYQNQVSNVISKYGFTNAIAYYEDYVEAVAEYKKNETAANKQAAEKAKNDFIASVVGDDLEDGYTNCKIGGVKEPKVSVDSCFYNCLADLSALLNSNDSIIGTRFIDKAAQLAYKMYPFSSQQYDFVMDSAKKQLLEITKVMLMYQEFIGMRAEYFQGISSGGIKTSKMYTKDELDGIYKESADNFYSVLESTDTRVSEWYNSKVYITISGNWLYISEYLTSEDAQTQILTINNFRNSVDYNFYLNESVKGRVESSIAIDLHINPSKGMANNAAISQKVSFNKDAAIVLQAQSSHAQVKPFYILDGKSLEEYQTKCQFFDHNVENFTMLYDLHMPRCDYYNLVQGVYSDGYKNFKCISNEEQLHDILNSSYYNLCNSSIKSYFSDFLGYTGDNNVYFMLNSPTNPSEQGAPTSYTVLPALDCTAEHTFTKTWTNSAIDLYNLQSNRKGSANKSSSCYAILLVPEDDNFKGKVEVLSDRAEATISGADYSYETGLATSGETAYINIAPLSGFEISSITVQLGSSTETLGRDQLIVNEDGSVALAYSVPYSNNLTVTVNTSPVALELDLNGNFIVEDYDDLCRVGYMVNSGKEEYINGNYVLADDIDCKTEDWTKREMIGTKDIQFNGTFDGQGHTISNLNYGADVEGEDSGNIQGLFAILGKNACVKKLNLDNATVWSDDSLAKGSAVIAKQNNGVISSCTVKNSLVQLGNSDYLGGITGVNNGTVEYCKVENSTLVRRWGGCGKRAMGNICEVNNGILHVCSASGCVFKNGTITDGSALFAVDTYFS